MFPSNLVPLASINLISLLVFLLSVIVPTHAYNPSNHPNDAKLWPSGIEGYTLETMKDENTKQGWIQYIKHHHLTDCLSPVSNLDRALFVVNIKLLRNRIKCDKSLSGQTFSINKFQHWAETNIWYEKETNAKYRIQWDGYKAANNLMDCYKDKKTNWIRYSICRKRQRALQECGETKSMLDIKHCDLTLLELENINNSNSTNLDLDEPHSRCIPFNMDWNKEEDEYGRTH